MPPDFPQIKHMNHTTGKSLKLVNFASFNDFGGYVASSKGKVGLMVVLECAYE